MDNVRNTSDNDDATMPEITIQQVATLSLRHIKHILKGLHNVLGSRATVTQALIFVTVAEYESLSVQELRSFTGLSAATASRIITSMSEYDTIYKKDGPNLLNIEYETGGKLHKRVFLTSKGKELKKRLLFEQQHKPVSY